MGYPRKNLISLSDTPYYHCIARCVRRAWLWGFDAYAGKNYSHRKQWVLDRLSSLADTFAIDICAFAIMSDHYHLVLRVDTERARKWDHRQIVERWSRIFRIPCLVDRSQRGEASAAERECAEQIIESWRTRLYDVSWFMRCLNEHLARRANAEDECSGRFWEGRFKSQALLDEVGLLTAMAYVDLNPVRAGIADKPEDAEFTSIYERIRRLNERRGSQAPSKAISLRPFRGDEDASRNALPYRIQEYLALVDWTGRSIRADKPGSIDATLPPILTRLQIDSDVWTSAMRRRGTLLGRAMARLDRARLHAMTFGRAWIRDLQRAETIYP